jgi:hypothetical protein
MDEDDIQKRIERKQAEVRQEQEARQAFIEALAEADSKALSALRRLCDRLLSIRAEVPETELLYVPGVLERHGMPQDANRIEDPSLWHQYHFDPDFFPPRSPRLHTELVGVITYDPTRDEWRCTSLKGPDTTPDAIVAAYSDSLADWVVRQYPRAKLAFERNAAEARKKEEREAEKAQREAEFDAYIERTPKDMALGCIGIVVLILILSLLMQAQFR